MTTARAALVAVMVACGTIDWPLGVTLAAAAYLGWRGFAVWVLEDEAA